jgi:hypothetical protein
MRTLVIPRVMVILIRWFFKRGRVLETTHELFKGGFEIFEIFDVGTFLLEDIERQID